MDFLITLYTTRTSRPTMHELLINARENSSTAWNPLLILPSRFLSNNLNIDHERVWLQHQLVGSSDAIVYKRQTLHSTTFTIVRHVAHT